MEEFLQSDDLEMVELGAVIMQNNLPRRMWDPILEEYSIVKQEYWSWSGYTNVPSVMTSRKWNFSIIKNEDESETIKIEPPVHYSTTSNGVWNQLYTGHTGPYTTLPTYSTSITLPTLSSATTTMSGNVIYHTTNPIKPTNKTKKWHRKNRRLQRSMNPRKK